MVVSLAAFVIAGPVSAVTIPSSGDDEEMVLMDTEESSVLDGLLYVVTCSLFGDFFGTTHESFGHAPSAPAQEPGIGGGEGLFLAGTDAGVEVQQLATPAPEPSAALLMALGMAVTGIRLRGRTSS